MGRNWFVSQVHIIANVIVHSGGEFVEMYAYFKQFKDPKLPRGYMQVRANQN